MTKEIVLEVKNLKTHFTSSKGTAKAVDGVDFSLHKGETVGIVGESGCGKSMTSLSILQLIPSPPGKIVDGEVKLNGQDLLKLSKQELNKIRGNKISMIFQEPMTSLNPVLTVGEQIAETLRHHKGLSKKAAWKQSIEMIRLVGIHSPEKIAKQEPFQLSGGMRQRIMIAMSLACTPEVLIADEPTTALDVTVQAQILELMKDLQNKIGMGIIFITHDLGVVSEICDQVVVMYAGKVVEHRITTDLFEHPLHPYTTGLLNSLPKLYEDQETLNTIEGTVPDPYDLHDGCLFAERCPFATVLCFEEEPSLTQIDTDTKVRCWKYTDKWHEEVQNYGKNSRV